MDKLHVAIFDNCVVQQSAVTEGSVHDINYLKFVIHLSIGKQLLGFSAYRSNPLQLEIFEKFDVKLKVPFRIKQRDDKKYPKRYK